MLISFICQSNFKFTAKEQSSHMFIIFPHMQNFPIINMTHQSGKFSIINKPTQTYHYHPRSQQFYIRVHCQCCTFCELGKKHHDVYPLSQYHTEFSHFPKILCLANPHLPPPALATIDLFTVFIAFAFFRMSHVLRFITQLCPTLCDPMVCPWGFSRQEY